MVTSIIPTNILGFWARLVWAGDTMVYQIKPEDAVTLYHYDYPGFVVYATGMTYKGIRITQCWKIQSRSNGIRLYSESTEDFIERTKDEPVEKETVRNYINGVEQV